MDKKMHEHRERLISMIGCAAVADEKKKLMKFAVRLYEFDALAKLQADEAFRNGPTIDPDAPVMGLLKPREITEMPAPPATTTKDWTIGEIIEPDPKKGTVGTVNLDDGSRHAGKVQIHGDYRAPLANKIREFLNAQ
jgi:hypothetical protein